MRLFRFGAPGQELPGVVLPDGGHVDARAVAPDWDEEFLDSGGLNRLRAWLARDGLRAPRVPADVRFGSALARPSKILCVGLNYVDHARETGAEIPKEPVLFAKATTALCGPNDDVWIPRGAQKLDWEVELMIVVGARARHVPVARALEHVAGLCLHNDYSEREFQLERGGQWVKGKSCDTFAPVGPYLVTLDEVADFRHLHLWLKVNGETRQDSSTKNMIFDVPQLVSYISQFMTLLPGDMISTGTPPGVGLGFKPPVYLQEGDVVESGIEGLGAARQRVAREP